MARRSAATTIAKTTSSCQTWSSMVGTMRFRSAILWALLLSLIGTAQAQLTSGGIFEIWLKAREAADATNDQKVTLYQKSKALVIGMDYDGRAWPHLSNGIRDAQEVAKALTAQGF